MRYLQFVFFNKEFDILEYDDVFSFPKMCIFLSWNLIHVYFYQYNWSTKKPHIFSFFFSSNKRKRHSCGNLQALKENNLALNRRSQMSNGMWGDGKKWRQRGIQIIMDVNNKFKISYTENKPMIWIKFFSNDSIKNKDFNSLEKIFLPTLCHP